ncbi:MAG: hypothetical protein ACLRMZ_18790 [Blautia marasmi]
MEELFKQDIHNLMMVVCFRDNEVRSEHPLILSLNKIIQWGGRYSST